MEASLGPSAGPGPAGMQQLPGGRGAGVGAGGHHAEHDGPVAACSGPNAMRVLQGAAHEAAGELDGEVIEELAHGAGAGGGSGGGAVSGLQEFATESGRRVVQVKATSSKGKGDGGWRVLGGAARGVGETVRGGLLGCLAWMLSHNAYRVLTTGCHLVFARVALLEAARGDGP